MRLINSSPLLWLGILHAAVPSCAQNTSNATKSNLPSLFISESDDIAFTLNVPNDSTKDLYFEIVMSSSVTWGAIGLGSKMAGSLMLIVYPDSTGKNVTLSTRLGSGHTEPEYTSDIRVETQTGTGLNDDGDYVFNGKCTNCRSWAGGSIDVASKSQSFLYATCWDGAVNSDDPKASLKMHTNYGTFQMDMVHATGPGAVPVIATNFSTDNSSRLIATTQGLSKFGRSDVSAMLHGIIMIFCIVGLFPFGTLILRLGNWVRWHAVNQGLGLIGIIVAVGLGIHSSFYYNRSRDFKDPHQIIGLVVFVLVLGQFTLGFMHHRIYKKTQQPTKLAPVHIWAGRLIILLGVINAFLGFPLALNRHYNYILAGLVIFVFPVIFIILLTKRFISKRRNRNGIQASDQYGYNLEPWRQPEAAPPSYYHQGAAMPAAGGAGAAMPPHTDMRSYANYQTSGHKAPDLGPQQSTRDYV